MNGFLSIASAPASRAASPSSPSALKMRMGSWEVAKLERIRRHASMPSMPGIMMSSTTTSGAGSARARSTATRPSPTVSTSYPSMVR